MTCTQNKNKQTNKQNLSQLSKESKQQNFKMGKRLEQTILHMKRCSPTLAIKEMQIKTVMTHPLEWLT